MFRLEYVKSPPEPLPRAVCAVCAVCECVQCVQCVSVCSVWRIGVCEIAANACIFFLSFSLSLCVFMCLCVYVFMQFMGQGATFTDYVQTRICEIAARASPAEQCVQCVAYWRM